MALTPEQRRQRARRTNLLMAYAYAAASTKGWTPLQLATGASTWAWYDPSDQSTLFQDSAGTTRVTAAGDPVGLILDKSGNGFNATQSTAAARPIYRIDANGRPYLEFDGTDDSLATGTINPGGVDCAQVFAGVRKLSDAAEGVVVESWGGSLPLDRISLYAPRSALPRYGFQSSGTGSPVADAPSASSFAAPHTAVLTAQANISDDLCTLRVNGAESGTSAADQGTGNFGAYALHIGQRGNGFLRYNGWLYGLIVRFSAENLNAAAIAQSETWMNGKTGAF